MSTDWLDQLWPTSFKGVPFWTRKVDSGFGKRLQEDEFPEVDTPFVQELGGAIAQEEVEAYLVGDTSDRDATAFVATLGSMGAGTLVHPTEGPIQVMFKTGRRAYALDRMGYIGFALTFVRIDATPTAPPSSSELANRVSIAADAVEGALAALTGQIVLS